MALAISPGMGCTLSAGGNAIGQVVSVGGPSYSKTQIETTHLGLSTGSHFRTYMQGINDGGEVSCQVQLDADDAGHAAIITEIQSDAGSALLEYILELADSGGVANSKWTFNGIITKADFGGMDIDGRITLDLTVKVSGKPTYAVGS